MALIIEAPNEVYSPENSINVKVFLAGGILGCPNWQSYVVSELKDVPGMTVYNPRRKDFPEHPAPKASEEQIAWEFEHLRDADVVLFWFSPGSPNPMALYELGMWANSRTDTISIVGADPTYERRQDVVVQTRLAKPWMHVFDSLDTMLEELDYVVRVLKGEAEEN